MTKKANDHLLRLVRNLRRGLRLALFPIKALFVGASLLRVLLGGVLKFAILSILYHSEDRIKPEYLNVSLFHLYVVSSVFREQDGITNLDSGYLVSYGYYRAFLRHLTTGCISDDNSAVSHLLHLFRNDNNTFTEGSYRFRH